MSSSYIFIYGALLSSLNHPMHDVLKRFAKLEGEGHIQAELYDLGQYPAVVLSENPVNRVKGEIYKISGSEKLLPVLDQYEGCNDNFPEPFQYLRRVVKVQGDDGTNVEAWVYLYNWDIARHTYIESGDYKKYVGERDR